MSAADPSPLLAAALAERQFIEELIDLVERGYLWIEDSQTGAERYCLTERGRDELRRQDGAA